MGKNFQRLRDIWKTFPRDDRFGSNWVGSLGARRPKALLRKLGLFQRFKQQAHEFGLAHPSRRIGAGREIFIGKQGAKCAIVAVDAGVLDHQGSQEDD